MDLTELSLEFQNKEECYLFYIIDHFSKYGMANIIDNKEAITILKYIKLILEYNEFPEEIGSDNGKEFKNLLIELFKRK